MDDYGDDRSGWDYSDDMDELDKEDIDFIKKDNRFKTDTVDFDGSSSYISYEGMKDQNLRVKVYLDNDMVIFDGAVDKSPRDGIMRTHKFTVEMEVKLDPKKESDKIGYIKYHSQRHIYVPDNLLFRTLFKIYRFIYKDRSLKNEQEEAR